MRLIHINAKLQVKNYVSYLKQDKLTVSHKKVVNIYIAFEINFLSRTQFADFTFFVWSC